MTYLEKRRSGTVEITQSFTKVILELHQPLLPLCRLNLPRCQVLTQTTSLVLGRRSLPVELVDELLHLFLLLICHNLALVSLLLQTVLQLLNSFLFVVYALLGAGDSSLEVSDPNLVGLLLFAQECNLSLRRFLLHRESLVLVVGFHKLLLQILKLFVR
jgi:hypothetical protein